MGYMMIDDRRVEFTDETNVLSVIRKAGIDIPTLCYHSELSVYGACRTSLPAHGYLDCHTMEVAYGEKQEAE